MKYEKPVFIVESYTFSDSIAACDIDADIAKPIKIDSNTSLCDVGDNGHHFGKKGSVISENPGMESTTLFNDGAESTACYFDWNGNPNIVYGPKKMETMILMVVLQKHFLEIVQMKIIMLQHIMGKYL